jgi:plasmid stabilization system protein ParE
VSTRYVIRPNADQDLDQQAYYPATEAGPETGHRFLVADSRNLRLALDPAPDGLASSSTEPGVASLRVFRISGFEKMLVLYTHLSSGVEIVRVILGSRDLRSLSAARKTVERISPVSDKYPRRHDSHGGAA